MKLLSSAQMGSLNKQRGFTLVEVMVAIALLMVLTVGSLSANSLATGAVVINQKRSQANFLAREAMEAIMSIRAASFTSLVAGDFHPVMTGAGWTISPGSETLGEFTRTVTISNVMRQLGCTISVCDVVDAGGVIDEGTLKVEVTVDWKESGGDKSYVLNSLVTYWR